MSHLYELTENFLELLEMLQDETYDEQCILDTLESVEYEIELKADSYAKIIKSLEGDIDIIEKEINRLSFKKQTYCNRIKLLKQNLENVMNLTGKRKFKTDLFSFNIQKNGGKRKLIIDVDIEEVPIEYRIKQPDKINSDFIREYLKSNNLERCEFAHLEEQGESLRIK